MLEQQMIFHYTFWPTTLLGLFKGWPISDGHSLLLLLLLLSNSKNKTQILPQRQSTMSARCFPEPIHFMQQFVPLDPEEKLALKQIPKPPELALSIEQFGSEKVFVMGQQRVDRGNLHLARRIAAERTSEGKNEAFLLFNVDTVVQQFAQWCVNMPRVKPFYAVKCNNDKVLLATLAALGAGFDCASREEIDLVMDNDFGRAEDIVYANTCKTPEFIRHAGKRGIDRFTFDCVEELLKMKREHKNPQMILRIDVTDASATRPLDIKFGCDPVADAPRLLRVARQLGVQLIGISFHVGSGAQNAQVYRQAIATARKLFTLGDQLGHKMHVLDLGGGYPGCEEEKQFFQQVAKVICEALDEFFPEESADSGNESEQEGSQNGGAMLIEHAANNKPKLEIIAEPGRYFASSPSAVCANVIGATRVNGRKLSKNSADEHTEAYMYYLDDGVYGSFSCLSSHLFTKTPKGRPLFPRKGDKQQKFPAVVWGPTCDSRDQVEQLCLKPRVQPGDWLFYSDMGAYTRVTATQFNGFSRPRDAYYVVGNQTWQMLQNRE